MIGTARLVAVLLVASALASWASSTPSPVAADAPPAAFSALRARADLTWIASAPHPTGSTENVRVRDRLIARLAELGLTSEIHRVENVDRYRDDVVIGNATIENVIARVPGRDPTLPPLLLMCHYDSAPESPGAADDGAGVATVLEIARIARSASPRQRDLLLLFSDGEELGMLGAAMFFKHHPLAKNIAAAVNLEARGGSGRAYLFETGVHSDGLVRAFAASKRGISSASFATFVYDHMPNGTDFTMAKHFGIPGFNFAFIADPSQYHTTLATPDALDLGSLQDMGDQALASVLCLDAQRSFDAPDGGLAWSDLLGHRLIVYGPLGGWFLIALTVALLGVAWVRLSQRPEGARLGAALRGAAFALLLLVVAAIALFATFPAAMMPGARASRLRLHLPSTRFELALFVLSIGVSVVVARLTRPKAAADEDAVWIGLLGFGACLTIALQAFAFRLAPPLAWPLLATAIGTLSVRSTALVRAVCSSATATFALALTLSWAHMVYLGTGISLPPTMTIFVLIASFAAYPLFVDAGRAGWRSGFLLVGVGLALALSVRLAV